MESSAKARRGSSKEKLPSSFGPFRRLLGYVWPHKKFLYPAIGCIILMAITYSISIGSVMPVLTVLVRPEGLHGWVYQYIAQKRCGCQFGVYSSLKDGETPGVPERAAKLIDTTLHSPMLAASPPIRSGAYLLAVNGVEGRMLEVIGQLVRDDTSFQITFRHPNHPEPQTATLTVQPLGFRLTLLRDVVAVIPGGTERGQRWITLIVVLALLAVVVLIGNIARFFAEYLTVICNCRAIMDMRRQMYSRVLRLPLSHFSRNTTDTMSRFVQDTAEIFRGLSNFFEKVVTEPFKAIGAFGVAFWINWQLTVVVIVATPVAGWLIREIGRKIRKANKKLLMAYSRMLGAMESTLTSIRVVKAYSREKYERRRLFSIDRQVLRHQLKMGRTEALASPFLEMLGFMAIAGAILYFGHGILNRGVEEETPEFMTMVVCLVAIFDPIRKLTTVYPKIQRANAAADRVFELLDTRDEFADDAGRPRLGPLQSKIEFDDVTFVYPETTRPALRDVSLTVQRGERIALVGPNGSGKTTLVSLLPRFFPINKGRILIDGQDITAVSLRSLRNQFSLITQESVIFPDTVRANIAYGRLEASEAEILAASRRAFADEFIQQMPQGYDTVVGEHGATLSGGQRQRIAIARAILRDSPILIFDEATSQVDPDSEQKIHLAMAGFIKDRTAFIIAHRFSTIQDADRIVVMDAGRIVGVGSHDELIVSCDLYRRLYETQFGGDADAAA